MLGFARKLVKQAEGIIAPEAESSVPTYGFRVLAVESDSEAFHAGIEPLFDFIIAANGERFDKQVHGPSGAIPVSIETERSPLIEFEQVVKSTQGKLVLELWSAKGRVSRILTLPNPNKLATGVGLSLQWTPLSVADNVWHILDVRRNSPADQAGLISDSDYIIGADKGLLEEGGEGLLGRVVSRADPNEGILFYVYNRDYDVVRPVRIVPSRDGKLGCGVGYGLLHSLPAVDPQGSRVPPGHTLFDDDTPINATYLDSSVSVAVPDASVPSAPPLTSPVSHAVKHNHHHHHNNNSQNPDALSAYFEEQSEISHSIDGSTSSTAPSNVPPPPKATHGS